LKIFVDIPQRIMDKLQPSSSITELRLMYNAPANRRSQQRRAPRAVALSVAAPVVDRTRLAALLISLIMLILVVGNSGVIV